MFRTNYEVNGAAHSGLGPPSLINQEAPIHMQVVSSHVDPGNPHQDLGHSSVEAFFSDDFDLCQIDS